MKRIHPNMSRVAHVAMLVFLSVQIGCKTPSGGIANPFLAPDRVPPPATRALMPGQAQPYYPGDPLPVMQSSTAPQQQPAPLGALAWNSPTESAAPSSEPRIAQLATTPNEKVAIPTDDGDLRFAGPRPEVPIQVALSNAAPAVTQSSTPAAPKHAAAQASFNELGASQLPTSTPDVNLVDVEVVSPWRPPQISQSVAAVSTLSAPPRVAIPGGDPSGLGVRLRAVPSPPAAPSAPAVPRIRLPGYYAPQPYTNAAVPPGTVIYGPPVTQNYGSAPQLVQISPMSLAGMPQPAASHDGFRPRTTMR
ncbi:MAG TPA: hypothetical protein VGK58_03220 [Lacipirellulaceae bacterium]